MAYFLSLLRFYFLKIWSHLTFLRDSAIERMAVRWLFKQSFFSFFSAAFLERKNAQTYLLNSIRADQKVIFFVFRDAHFVDWFLPIHRALERNFSTEFVILYVDFASTLKRIGSGINYLRYRNTIQERILDSGIPGSVHFSHLEISDYENFPSPDVIFTTESIRKENFPAPHRVYLPHYSVLKKNDLLPKNIRFNHVFVPSKGRYTYEAISNGTYTDAKVHNVGYPKMHAFRKPPKRFFENDRPVVIYAPTGEIETIMGSLRDGILEVFKKMNNLNFIYKTHPSLSSRRHYIGSHIEGLIRKIPNVILDISTSIQELSINSEVLIADFGSVGAEYRISFGKRVVFLKVPRKFEGGADLLFRDEYGDGSCDVAHLEETLNDVLALGDLSDGERQEMGEKILHCCGEADACAAKAIKNIVKRD